jgi:hypothetical protein
MASLPSGSAFELVDVGAGAGLLGSYLSRDRPEATYRFVEPIESLNERLRSIYGGSADAAASDFFKAQYVTLLDVLEHQEDDHGFMVELVGKMAPGSILLLTVPALPRLWSSWDVALGHFRRYERASLLACIDGLPLNVLEVSYLCPELVPAGKVRVRRLGVDAEGIAADDAEFPDLPAIVNDVLYALGSISISLRRRWKRGTSLFLAATVIA